MERRRDRRFHIARSVFVSKNGLKRDKVLPGFAEVCNPTHIDVRFSARARLRIGDMLRFRGVDEVFALRGRVVRIRRVQGLLLAVVKLDDNLSTLRNLRRILPGMPLETDIRHDCLGSTASAPGK